MIVVVAAIIRRNGKILITRRPANVHLSGLWEFPGGKVESGESLESALAREIREELGIEIEGLREYFTIDHAYPGKFVRLHFFDCRVAAGEPQAIEVADFRWVYPSELAQLPFPEADRTLLARLSSESSTNTV